MGEAANRGNKCFRVQQAEARQEAIDDAAKSRKRTEGLVWLVIESSPSIAVVSSRGAFELDSAGKIRYGADPGGWKPLLPDDVPEWVKDPGVIKEMMDGVEVSKQPGDGGRWFRGVVNTPSDPKGVH